MFGLEDLPSIQIYSVPMIHWDMTNCKSPQEPTPKGEQNEYAACRWLAPVDIVVQSSSLHCHWAGSHPGEPLQNKLSVLEDWAIALTAYHTIDLVHGYLTPESVGVVHGRGTLFSQGSSPHRGLERWAGQPLDDDVYGARWAATELFRLDDGNLRPTRMSDVYSFACLMLQMLTGSVPYCGTKRPEQVVYLKYLGREPIDAETPQIADHYVAFMRWCWSAEPERRPTMDTVVGFIHEEIKKLADQRD